MQLFPIYDGTWTSSDSTIATITLDGLITAKASGTVTFIFMDLKGCNSTTDSVTVLPYSSESIDIIADNSVCIDTDASFIVNYNNNGSPSYYQWKKNGIPVGINTSTYTYKPENGDVITCTVIVNNACATNTNDIIMTVKPRVVPSIRIELE